jgi:hypothetical protein
MPLAKDDEVIPNSPVIELLGQGLFVAMAWLSLTSLLLAGAEVGSSMWSGPTYPRTIQL